MYYRESNQTDSDFNIEIMILCILIFVGIVIVCIGVSLLTLYPVYVYIHVWWQGHLQALSDTDNSNYTYAGVFLAYNFSFDVTSQFMIINIYKHNYESLWKLTTSMHNAYVIWKFYGNELEFLA